MSDLQLLITSVVVTVVGFWLFLVLPSRVKPGFNALLVLITSVFTSILAVHALHYGTVEILFQGSAFFGTIPIRIDALSAWFILIINFTCLNGALYGIGYMKPYQQQKSALTFHWMLFLLFHSSMVWVCILQHSMAFLIAWELMSLSSMLLVIFDYQKKNTLKAGINYLVQMHIGVLFLTIAFIWVYYSEGSFDFASIGKFFESNPNTWLFLLFFAGFGIKAGFIPLHTWLPQAHPAAPSHVSGVMSGVIVKLGIYGIFRIATYLQSDCILIGGVVLGVSLFTGLFGIYNAAVRHNYKKMLAYCTIENIGIIGMGIGLGIMGLGNGNVTLVIAGFGGALLHTLNHSLFKSLLFFAVGSVYQQTHTRNMERLGGLIRKMPQTAMLFLVGAIAIGGLPPFNGFVSEFILYSGLLEGIRNTDFYQTTLMIFSIAGLAIIGGISLLTFTKAFGTVFLGVPRHELLHEPHEVAPSMRWPLYLIALVMLSIGIFPQFWFGGAIHTVLKSFPARHIEYFAQELPIIGVVAKVGIYSFAFLVLVVVVYSIRTLLAKQHAVSTGPTWGCGYTAPNPRIQYTNRSFAKSLSKLLTFASTETKRYSEITVTEIFPKERAYSSNYIDIFGIYINRIVDRVVFGLNYFQFVQNGSTQMYILYGLFFIVLVFVGTLFNII
jgi:hydrogenase-4 component B